MKVHKAIKIQTHLEKVAMVFDSNKCLFMQQISCLNKSL